MFRIYDIFFCINYDNYILLLIIFFKLLIIMELIKIVLDAWKIDANNLTHDLALNCKGNIYIDTQ